MWMVLAAQDASMSWTPILTCVRAAFLDDLQRVSRRFDVARFHALISPLLAGGD